MTQLDKLKKPIIWRIKVDIKIKKWTKKVKRLTKYVAEIATVWGKIDFSMQKWNDKRILFFNSGSRVVFQTFLNVKWRVGESINDIKVTKSCELTKGWKATKFKSPFYFMSRYSTLTQILFILYRSCGNCRCLNVSFVHKFIVRSKHGKKSSN